jgi:hypothetical protein
MSTNVSYSPEKLDFSGVYANSSGPDITSDTTDGLYTLINFAGGVHITNIPADTTVTAHIIGDTSHFMVRDVTALEWVSEVTDSRELSHGHKSPPKKIKLLEPRGLSSDGVKPLAVKAGQEVLVRVAYTAPDEGTCAGTLIIQGDNWQPIEVGLSFFVVDVLTTFAATSLEIAQGGTATLPILVSSLAGPDVDVTYVLSVFQFDTGLSLLPLPEPIHLKAGEKNKPASLTFQADTLAPLGSNNVLLEQYDFQHKELLLPVNIVPSTRDR